MNGTQDSQPRGTAVSKAAMRWSVISLSAVALAASSAAGPVKIERDRKTLEFTYSWPAEAATVPALDHRFRTEAKLAFRKAMANARGDEILSRQQKRDFNPEFYSKQWTTAGQSARLLALEYELGTFTGGAHPNTSYGALLWDRRAAREIGVTSLFRTPGSFAALTRTFYCHALDQERAKRREGQKLDLAEFSQCPKYSDLAIAPLDKSRNGRFDTIHFVASPYAAGPYVEGAYEIELPVTSQLIAAIKPAYRSSFERQRQ